MGIKAKAQLTTIGFDVTYYEEPGVEHALESQIKIEMNKWFEIVNVTSSAQRYYDEAQELLRQLPEKEPLSLFCM